MQIMLDFLAGLLLCNAIPHLAAGLRGETFPTPFARPHGVGLSPALVNFLWGMFNLAAGLALSAPSTGLRIDLPVLALAAGFLLAGLFTSWHFGKVRRAREGGPAA